MNFDFTGQRVLILGGAGFIGQHLCRALLLSGAEVRCFDRGVPPADSVARNLGREAEWRLGDFSNPDDIAAALRDVDYVIHLISTTIPETSNRDLQADLSQNVYATLSLLEGIRASGVKKTLFASSGGTVYGIPKTIPIPESHDLNPICGYGIHKLAIEKYLHLYHYNFGMDYCALRLANPYGAAQISDRSQGAIGRFVYKAVRNEKIEVWGDGSVIRDYLCIDDIVEAFLISLTYGGVEKVFNVGSGQGHSLMDILALIETSLGRSLRVDFLPPRHVDVPVNVLSVDRIAREMLWSAKIELSAGIDRMVEYGLSEASRP